jgi:hypothetical protein
MKLDSNRTNAIQTNLNKIIIGLSNTTILNINKG